MTKIEELKRRIFDLESQVIDVERFYLAFKISQCQKCNVTILDWGLPIIMSGRNICEKHQKELDEFNRKYASD